MQSRRTLPLLIGVSLFTFTGCMDRAVVLQPLSPVSNPQASIQTQPSARPSPGSSVVPSPSPSPSLSPSPSPSPSSSPSPTPVLKPSGKNSGKYTKLVWNDEFSGTGGLDHSKWNIEVNCDGGGNNEWQCYTDHPETIQKDGQGHLDIRLKKNFYGRGGYTSGRIHTKNKGDWAFGRFEARIQVPKGNGMWPAFWMMPTQSVYGGWPTSGEIDIMEILSENPVLLHGVAHYGVAGPYTHTGRGHDKSGDLSLDYHVYALERDSRQMRWYIDDVQYFTLNDTDLDYWVNTPWARGVHPDGSKWPFNQDFYLIMNLAMGGNWPTKPDESIVSADMLIDFVRVFQ